MLNQMTHRLAFVGAILALLVIMLGAYTRITGSGLGCPDWPGCYGQWHVPDTLDQIYRAQTHYPNSSLVSAKAWTEMIHRYLAGSLVLVILAIAATAWRRRRLQRDGLLPFILVPLILLQALLGMWTVTLKLNPAVVMLHLFGGMSSLALLWVLMLRAGQYFERMDNNLLTLRPWAVLGLLLVVVQLLLGGWTSANYAGLVCPNFPFCMKNLIWQFDFTNAFSLGNSQDIIARMTIQMLHRLGAALTAIYLIILASVILVRASLPSSKYLAVLLLALTFVQISLGIASVYLHLPLLIAVSHSAVAALLLLTIVTVNCSLYIDE